ncbi:MAG: competence protein ComK [Bacilli bacterium]
MMQESYEINRSTCAVIPIDENTSKIIEKNDSFIINQSVSKIIENSCRFFGSSYLGRHEGTKNLIGFNYKAPIIIEETNELIFFPTSSPRFNKCSWICLKSVKDYQRKNRISVVCFDNGQDLEIDISYESLENQILRATRLESILRSRKLS